MKRKIFFLLLFIVSLTGWMVYKAIQVKFDYDFEKFFPKNSKETNYFLNHRKRFSPDNDFVLIAIENKKGIFNVDFLNKVKKFSKKLEKLKYVQNVVSITNQKEYFIYSNGMKVEIPYIHFSS